MKSIIGRHFWKKMLCFLLTFTLLFSYAYEGVSVFAEILPTTAEDAPQEVPLPEDTDPPPSAVTLPETTEPEVPAPEAKRFNAAITPLSNAESPYALAGTTYSATVISNGVSAVPAQTEGSTVVAITSAKVSYLQPAGGFTSHYTASPGGEPISFNNDLRLDDAYLQSVWDKIYLRTYEGKIATDYLLDFQENPTEGTLNALKACMEAVVKEDPAILPVVFNFHYGANFETIDHGIYEEKALIEGVETRIGTHQTTTDANGNVTSTFICDPLLFALSGVKAGYSEQIYLNKSLFNDSDHVVVSVENGSTLVVKGLMDKTEHITPDKNYTLDKYTAGNPGTLTTTTDALYIDYVIPVQVADNAAPGSVLTGKLLEDKLPLGLTIESVSLAQNGGTALPLSPGTAPGSYTLSQDAATEIDTFSYRFVKDGTADITRAEFTLRLRMTEATYKAYLQSGSAGFSATYKNKAVLRDLDGTTGLSESGEVTTTMTPRFFHKDGQQNPYNGNIFDWKIDVDTFFSRFIDAYLVDSIDGTKQHYNTDSLKITGTRSDGTPIADALTITPVTDADLPGLTSGALTNDSLKDPIFLAKLQQLTGGNTHAILYTNPTTKEEILIMPFEAYTNAKVSVAYTTTLSSGSQGEQKELTNNAKLIWRLFGYGDGPGEPFDFNVSISKSVTATYEHLQKSVDTTLFKNGYDAATHQIAWRFKINPYRKALTDVTLTEDLSTSAMSPGDTTLWHYTHYIDGVKADTGTLGTLPTNTPYYSQSAGIYTFHFGNLTEADYYEMTLTTAVTGSFARFDSQNGLSTVKNTATLTHGPTDNRVSHDISFAKPLSNTLIEKSGGSYNVSDRSIPWTMTINPLKLPLNNSVVTDVLPKGNTLAGSVAVTKTTGSVSLTGNLAMNGTLILGNTTIALSETDRSSDPLSEKNLIFTFSGQQDDESTYTFAFNSQMGTTPEDFAYLNTLLSDNSPKDIVNQSRLSGNILDQPIFDTANQTPYVSASATTPVGYLALGKTGTFDKTTGILTWTIMINEGQVDMTGRKIIEDFRSNQILQLASSGLKVEAGHMDAGAFIAEADVTAVLAGVLSNVDGSSAPLDEMGFILTIPDAITATGGLSSLKNKTLRLSVPTKITDNTDGTDVSNTVVLTNTDGTPHETATHTATGTGNYFVSDYAFAETNPYIRVTKLSENRADDGSKVLKLPGAGFTLTAYRLDTASNTYVKAATPPHQRLSLISGHLSFMGLERDVLYKLEETKAPNGYALATPNAKYFLFKKTSNPLDSMIKTNTPFTLSDNGTDTYSVTGNLYSEKMKSFGYDFSDTPGGQVAFVKYRQDGKTPLAGATFTLHRTDDTKVKDQVLQSGADGLVTFNAVDPGHYTLTETQSPDGYKFSTGVLFEAVVTPVEGTPSCLTTYTAVDQNHVKLLTDTLGVTTVSVSNTLLLGTIKLTKTDQNGTPLNGVTFTLSDSGSGSGSGTVLEPSTLGDYTTVQGELTLRDLSIGDYTLTEKATGDIDGKIDPANLAVLRFTLSRASDGTLVVKRLDPLGTATLTPDADGSYYLPGKNGSANKPQVNTLKTAALQLKKVSEDTKQTLDGVTFKLYRRLPSETAPVEKNLLLTLKTDTRGQFMQNSDTSYTDSTSGARKWLVYGDYWLVESASVTGHSRLTTPLAFTLSDTTTGALGTAWISAERHGGTLSAAVTYYLAGVTPDETKLFNNAAIRGEIQLVKKGYGTDTIEENDARFVVRAGSTATSTAVASLRWDAGSGTYRLSNIKDGGGIYTATKTINASKVDYLYQSGAGTPFKLLQGTYTIWETTAPENYTLPGTAVKTATIDTKGTVSYSGGAASNQVNNIPATATLLLDKSAHAGALRYYLSDITFTLSGTDFGGEVYNQSRTTATPYTDALRFDNLKAGTYTLTETGHDGYLPLSTTYGLVVEKAGTLLPNTLKMTLTRGDTGEVIPLTASDTTFKGTLENTPITGDIAITKVDTEGRRLTDVTFTLSQILRIRTANGFTDTEIPVASAKTDSQGQLTFSAVPYGNYRLRETPPPGVKPLEDTLITTKDLVITKDASGKDRFSYEKTQQAKTNTLITGTLDFEKIDQNGAAIPVAGVSFILSRKGGGAADSFDLTPTGDTYSDFQIKTDTGFEACRLSTDAHGKVHLAGLPIGDYRLTEIIDSTSPIYTKLRDPNAKITADFSVSIDTGGTALVTKGKGFTNGNIQNVLASGTLQINKVFGEQAANTPGQPLPQAVFNLYHRSAQTLPTAQEPPVITLSTDAQGHFTILSDPIKGDHYTTGSAPNTQPLWLLPGDYWLKEVSPGNTADYRTDEAYYPFTIAPDTQTLVSTDPTATTFNNQPRRGLLQITKLDENFTVDAQGQLIPRTGDGMPVNGADFIVVPAGDTTHFITHLEGVPDTPGVYRLPQSPNTQSVSGRSPLTHNPLGTAYLLSGKLLYGDYQILEVTPPVGYLPSSTLTNLTINSEETAAIAASKTITNTLITQPFSLFKRCEQADPKAITAAGAWVNANADDRQITFSLERISTEPTFGYKRTLKTDAQGIADFGTVPYGTYALREIAAPDPYRTLPEGNQITVTKEGVTFNTTPLTAGRLTLDNALKRGSIEGVKRDTATTPGTTHPVEGAVIGLFDQIGSTQLAAATTDKNGHYQFLSVPLGSYQIKEIAAPPGYILNPAVLSVTLDQDLQNLGEQNLENTMISGSLSLTKKDRISLAPLAEVTFTLTGENIYGDPFTLTQTTDSAGKADFTPIPLGQYTLTETHWPEGYQTPAQSYPVTLSRASDNTVNVIVDGLTPEADGSYTLANEQNKGTITFNKVGQSDEIDLTQTSPLKDAQFTLYKDPEATQPLAVATSDSNGTVTFPDIHVGTWYLKETAAPPNYHLDTTLYRAVIGTDGSFGGIFKDSETQGISTIVNTPRRGQAVLTKHDSLTHAPLAGVTFSITRKGEATPFETAISDAQGQVTFSNLLMDRAYTVTETQTLETYMLSSQSEAFTLQAETPEKNLGIWLNDPTSFAFKKTDPEGNPLAGATFGLYDNDIEVTRVTSDAQGIVTLRYLSRGKTYTLKELEAPPDYFIAPDPFTLTLDALGQGTLTQNGTTVTEVINTDKGQIGLSKKGPEGLPLEGAVFELRNADGTPLATQTTDATGHLTFTELPLGTYTIKESKAPEGYVLSEDITTITLTKGSGQKPEITRVNQLATLRFNKALKISETCSTTPEATAPLAGAVFGIYSDAEATHKIAEATSDTSGQVSFTHLPVGRYTIKEERVTGEGIALNPQLYTADIDRYGRCQGLTNAAGALLPNNTVINDSLRGDILLQKVNEQHPDQVVPLATYGLYHQSTSGEEALIATAITDTQGQLRFEGVLTGKTYRLRELVAPDGYHLSEKPVTLRFTADENQQPQISDFDGGKGTAEAVEGKVLWYEPQTMVRIAKKDPQGNFLAGARLRITHADGTPVKGLEDWISTDDTARLIEGILIRGQTYTLTEVQAPSGYTTAAPITFTIPDRKVGPKENLIQSLELVNTPIAPIKTPTETTTTTITTNATTGIAENPTSLAVLLLLVGITGGAVLYFKRGGRKD